MEFDEQPKFAAVFVLKISVEGDMQTVLRLETYLFVAANPDDAFEQAIAFGPRLDDKYRNSDGKVVSIEWLGIHQLDRVEPDLEGLPGLVSAAQFAVGPAFEPNTLVARPDELACYGPKVRRSGMPNLDSR